MIHPSGVAVKPNRPWRFERVWLDDEGCNDTVNATWRVRTVGSLIRKVVQKISACQNKLQWSNKNCFGNIT